LISSIQEKNNWDSLIHRRISSVLGKLFSSLDNFDSKGLLYTVSDISIEGEIELNLLGLRRI
jgi:hypothetical protein